MSILTRRRQATSAPLRKPSDPSAVSVPVPEQQQPHNPNPQFSTLPPEIHLLISSHLIYPDALSLKHTNRYFYRLVDTGVRLKVEWLMERRKLHLECPSNHRCDLGSDLRFCRGSVKLLMQRRREHVECESRPGLGCLIYGTKECPNARRLRTRLKRWVSVRMLEETGRMRIWLAGLVVLVVIPAVLGWAWMLGVMAWAW
ncbi:hypothetical protein QBC38DRAFT_454124 [Podospora fimiseda]|uniref:F-box domain-containing protein n=1 Tax=Podospora fimiseda TaxID=252190 RepID=A0AAN7BS61_9PEZI|nr:hypothetical protein QBC38DRAFT_454124 [Podospora fimiseda]